MHDSITVLQEASITQIETPTSSLSAKEGCTAGYAKNIVHNAFKGVEYYNHSGGLDGFLSYLTYIPSIGIGYFFTINLSDGDAFNDLQRTMLGFLLNDHADTARFIPATPDMFEYDITGYYRTASSRNQIFRLIDWLAENYNIKEIDGELYHFKTFEKPELLYYDGISLIHKNDKGFSSPIVFSEQDGRLYLQIPGRMSNYAKTTGIAIWWQLIVAILTAVLIVSAIAIGIVRLPFWIFSKKKRVNKKEKIFPIMASLFSALWLIPLMLGMQGNPLENFGNLTVYSFSISVLTILFAALTIFAILISLRSYLVKMKKFYRFYFFMVSMACLVMTIYLFNWHWIGIRFWVY